MKNRASYLLLLATGLIQAVSMGQSALDAKARQASTTRKIERLRLRTIFIAFEGFSKKGGSKLSKEDAGKLADKLMEELEAGGDFESLAKQHSADPSRLIGGYLGQVRLDRVRESLSSEIRRLKVRDRIGPLATDFGFHIFEKLLIRHPWPERILASQILIRHSASLAATGQKSKLTREAAKRKARKIHAEIKAEKLSFAEAVLKYSEDERSKSLGGSLGVASPDDFIPTFSDTIVRTRVGEISRPVETPMGFHIILRQTIPSPYHASHILIPWQNAEAAPKTTSRNKAEALSLATKILREIRQGKDFAKIAVKYSSGPRASGGGDLGLFEKGSMLAEIESALDQTKKGELAGPIESSYGYHILRRHR